MSERVIQRCVFPSERRLQPLYYRLDRSSQEPFLEPSTLGRLSVRIPGGCKFITDTYFNSLFESYWRRYTTLGRLRLRLRLTGKGTVLLVRRTLAAGLAVLGTAEFDVDDGEVTLDIPEPDLHYRQAGAVHFDIVAESDEVILHRADWVALDVVAEPVRMVAGYCTFNREKYLLANVRALLDDPEVAEVLERVVVVDQGTSRVRDHESFEEIAEAAGPKLRVLEQGNFGGAGGFTRSILEARALPGATHMLLMDDDAVTEPESVFRAAAFQSLAKEDMGIGGQMLDMLRPMEVYESGALLDPFSLGVKTPIHRLHAESPAALHPFLEVAYVHYNAWWFFAFPLRLVDKVGLPLPLFIRGDDVEFGFRLFQGGITTATVPGLGIWHEPFYLKRGSWQAYYDLRNMLVLTSLHTPLPPRGAAKLFLRRMFTQLFSNNYFEAAILIDAVEDYCRGVEFAEADPGVIHRKLLARKKELVPESVPRSRCLPMVTPAGAPATEKQYRRHMLRCLIRQLRYPSPPATAPPVCVIPDDYARWWCLSMTDVIAVEDWHTESHRVYRRSRRTFVTLLKRGLKAALQLRRDHARIGHEWRAAFPRLTNPEFWNRYLGIKPEAHAAEAGEELAHRAA